ncbi:MAG: polysaccharide deacetylase family protein [Clostridia bacterium]|nr:polysaccharide deacetylase family protein [Clostridia bacterium]
MSCVSKAIGLAKKVKHSFDVIIKASTPVYLSSVRRIERVATDEKICAMTFDDGPFGLPANPDKESKPLTLLLAETLEKYGAKGTFDVIGDTSGNYPDSAGKEGTAKWGGIAYDHYPDINRDSFGGCKNQPQLLRRLIDGGHEITNHTYSHVLFGKKPIIYGARVTHKGIDDVIADLMRLHSLLYDEYGYEMKLSRPPHYVDKISGGFSSYDAYAACGYQYMAASFDGAGWLPKKSYDDEVLAMTEPVKSKLETDENFFCGQIIFQKDGCNMLRRTPVADGLGAQLKLLTDKGYKIVSVSELIENSPFADIKPSDELFCYAKKALENGFDICYRDNTVRKNEILTRGEAVMMLYGKEGDGERLSLIKDKRNVAKDVKFSHPYSGAMKLALENLAISKIENRFKADMPIGDGDFSKLLSVYFNKDITLSFGEITHGEAIKIIAEQI